MTDVPREDLPTVLEVLAEWKPHPKNSALPPALQHSGRSSHPDSKESHNQPHPDSKNSALPRNLWMRTELYSSHQIKYVRFRWGKGRQTFGYLHISGGDCTNPLVQQRQALVDRLIREQASIDQIKKTIAGTRSTCDRTCQLVPIQMRVRRWDCTEYIRHPGRSQNPLSSSQTEARRQKRSRAFCCGRPILSGSIFYLERSASRNRTLRVSTRRRATAVLFKAQGAGQAVLQDHGRATWICSTTVV